MNEIFVWTNKIIAIKQRKRKREREFLQSHLSRQRKFIELTNIIFLRYTKRIHKTSILNQQAKLWWILTAIVIRFRINISD